MTSQAMVRWGPGAATVAIGTAGMVTAAVPAPPGGGVVSIGIYMVVLALAGGVLTLILALQHSIMERRRKRHTPVAHA